MLKPRISKVHYYLSLAAQVSERGTCLRRRYGAVIVVNDEVISTGYVGSPRGTANCADVGACLRNQLGAKKGEHYEWCRSVHAEMNACISAARAEMMGGTLYLAGFEVETGKVVKDAEPCRMCKRVIINAGIVDVVVMTDDAAHPRGFHVADWVKSNLGEYRTELISDSTDAGTYVKYHPIKVEGY